MKVAIRADASREIGSGHVMRCLTLADALRDQGDSVRFFCRAHDGNLVDLIEQKGYAVTVLRIPSEPFAPVAGDPGHAAWLGVTWEEDAEQMRHALLTVEGADWLIVDHYAIDERWERELRPFFKRVLVIDDLADRKHDCDLLLDQNFYEGMYARYRALVPSRCQQLLGPRYAILRPEFLEARELRQESRDAVRKILVFFGGADPQNNTEMALEGLLKLGGSDVSVDIVVGLMNPNLASLREKAESNRHVALHVQVENMAELMANADLTIGAGGTATWERCCVGVPTIAWPVAANQEKLIEDAAVAGFIYVPDETSRNADGLAIHLQALIENTRLRNQMSKRGRSYVDGNGLRRLLSFMSEADIRLRNAEAEDVGSIFQWRNHPSVRAHSRNKAPISWDEHKTWYERASQDPDNPLLVGEIEGDPVGVLRYEVAGTQAEVSVYLVPEKQGKGYGASLLLAGERWLSEHKSKTQTITAEVLDENAVSHGVFKKCGYAVISSRYEKRIK